MEISKFRPTEKPYVLRVKESFIDCFSGVLSSLGKVTVTSILCKCKRDPLTQGERPKNKKKGGSLVLKKDISHSRRKIHVSF